MKKGKILTLVCIAVFAVGVVIALLPLMARFGSAPESARAITMYSDSVSLMEDSQCKELLETARQYNAGLLERGINYILPDKLREEYDSFLDPAGEGVMGYLDIPKIDTTLPICHGTGDEVLSTGIGHLEWSSLPVGGTGTHSVLSGHNGLRGAMLLRDLDQLREGDIFYLRVLEQTLAYEVDQICVTEPDDVSLLMIDEYRDYCTLMTCTPFGRNTHRLLVRGRRVEVPAEAPDIRITSDATRISKSTVAFFAAIPLLFILLITGAVLFMSLGEGEGKNEKKSYLKTLLGTGDVPDMHIDNDSDGLSG